MSTNIRVEKICEYCQKKFIAKTLKTRFCSHLCNSSSYKAKKRAEKLNPTKDVESTSLPKPSTSLLHTIQNKQVLTVDEVATLLRLSKATVYRIIKEGKLKAVKFSARNTRIYRTEIDKLFNQSNPF